MCRKLFCLCVCWVALCASGFAQPKPTNDYPFIDNKANRIEYLGNSKQGFDLLWAKFRTLIRSGQNQIRILHIGDSHLQADFFSGRVRADFQTMLPGISGARGMVSPFAKGCPDSYRVNLGKGCSHFNILSRTHPTHHSIFANTVFITDTVAELRVEANRNNPVKYDFNSLRIYHSPLKEGESMELSDSCLKYTKQYRALQGYTLYTLDNYTDKVSIRVRKSDVDTLYIYGFYLDNSDAGVVYNAVGVNSAEARHYLKMDVQGIVSSLDADLIIISLGTNDCYEAGGIGSFGQNMSKLIELIRQESNAPVLLTTPSECWYKRKSVNNRMKQASEILRRVAEKENCALWDWYAVMGGDNSSSKWIERDLMQKDRVHLTLKGYYLQGDLLFNALLSEILGCDLGN